MSSIYNWFQERIEFQAIADDVTTKYVPPHVNLFYCLGGITLTLFILQVATGFALTFFYRPTIGEALNSVMNLGNNVTLGWLLRSGHLWVSTCLVTCMLLHVARVYLTGGFKAPREMTWLTGLLLALGMVTFGVTGYSLPWDQIGYWACVIVTGVPSVFGGLLGDALVRVLRGGRGVGSTTLTRYYQAHTFILPLAVSVTMLVHFLMIRKQGISGPL
jgi:cytochrome b6